MNPHDPTNMHARPASGRPQNPSANATDAFETATYAKVTLRLVAVALFIGAVLTLTQRMAPAAAAASSRPSRV
jgi:hypothetical protein